VELFKTLELPQFERDTEFVCLYNPDEYALYKGDIIRSTKCGDTPLADYSSRSASSSSSTRMPSMYRAQSAPIW